LIDVRVDHAWVGAIVPFNGKITVDNRPLAQVREATTTYCAASKDEHKRATLSLDSVGVGVDSRAE
jgi:hypothetical protein